MSATRDPSMIDALERGKVLAIRFVAHVASLDDSKRARIASRVATGEVGVYDRASAHVRASTADPAIAHGETFFAGLDAVVDATLTPPLAPMVKHATRALVVHALPVHRDAFVVLYAPFEDDVAFATLLLS